MRIKPDAYWQRRKMMIVSFSCTTVFVALRVIAIKSDWPLYNRVQLGITAYSSAMSWTFGEEIAAFFGWYSCPATNAGNRIRSLPARALLSTDRIFHLVGQTRLEGAGSEVEVLL